MRPSKASLLYTAIVIILFALVAYKLKTLLTAITFFHIYTFFAAIYLLTCYVFSRRYTPSTYIRDNPFLPSITAVIPCYNDEDLIEASLLSYKKQIYPIHKLDIIVVNDGSTDHSLKTMHRLQSQMPNLRVIDLKQNKGKRTALAIGIKAAKGGIIVSTDSDTKLEHDALRELVSPFIDSKIQGVVGRAKIWNVDQNLLTKAQQIYYWFSFEILRSSQSLHQSVICLSGCLNAYRRDFVLPFLDEYTDRLFLGTRPTAADDRALTRLILQHGGDTVYIPSAICYTTVPSSLVTLLKQQVRWKRGTVRETLLYAKFMWRKHIVVSTSFYLSMFLMFFAPVSVINQFLTHISLLPLVIMIGSYFISPAIATIYYCHLTHHVQLHYFLWAFLWLFLFLWLLPYALVTITHKGWMTR